MNSVKRILVPTDFSDSAAHALQKAVEIARTHGAEILLLYVTHEADFPTHQVLQGRGFPNLRDEIRKGVEARLQDLRKEHIGDDVACTVTIRDGVPSAEIADAASEHTADMIVIATHGHTGLKRFFLGSTAERVIRLSPCSVLVIKEPHAG